MHEITRGGYPFDDGHCVDCQQDAVVVLFCGGAQCAACVKSTYRAQTWPYLNAAFAQAAQHYDDQRIAASIWKGVPGMIDGYFCEMKGCDHILTTKSASDRGREREAVKAGWNSVNGLWFCPKHYLLLTADIAVLHAEPLHRAERAEALLREVMLKPPYSGWSTTHKSYVCAYCGGPVFTNGHRTDCPIARARALLQGGVLT